MEVADSRVKAGEEAEEKQKKRQNGDEEIDGHFKMQEKEGIGVGLRVSAVKTTKNRDDAMVKWSFEKETRRFRSSFWFCLPSIPSKGETGGAKPPRSAVRTTSARAPETASTAFQRAFHRYGVAVRGEQARKPRILRRKERGVGGARDAGNCVILKLSAIYAGILGIGYMAGKWLRE